MSGIMDKLRHKHTTPATGTPITQDPYLMQQQQAGGFIQPGLTKQSSIVQPGLLQEQPLQTTHMAAPIVQETIRNDRVVEVQPIIHREVDKNVVHHIEKHIQEAHAPSMGGVVERPAIVQQEIHTNVINEIQPVIHRERVVPVVERAEQHTTQRIVEPTIHTHEVTYENSSSLYQQPGLLPSQSSSFQQQQQQQQQPFQHGVPLSSTGLPLYSTPHSGLPSQSSSMQIPLEQQQQFPLPQQNLPFSQQQQNIPLAQQGVGAMAAGMAANSILNKNPQQNLPLSQQPFAQNQQNLPLSQQGGVGAMAANALLHNQQPQHLPLSQQQQPLSSQLAQNFAQPLAQNQQNLPLSQQPFAQNQQQPFSQPLSQQPLAQQNSLGQGIMKGVENEVLNSMGTKSATPLGPTSNQQAIGRQGF